MARTNRQVEQVQDRQEQTIITLSSGAPERNPGMPFDEGWIRSVHINRSAVERRAATLSTRRTVKKEWQAAWLLRAVTCIDLTTLAGDVARRFYSISRKTSPCAVKSLCARSFVRRMCQN